MRNAVVTLTIGERYTELAKLTHPILKAYADKIGAEFVVIDKDHGLLHWEKYQIYNLLMIYNRIIFFDTDIIIRDDCPNLFDLVPYDEIALFNEGRYDNRYNAVNETVKAYEADLKEWDGTYYNTGTIVLSRYHMELFKDPIIKDVPYVEQSFLNLRILLDPVKWKVFSLSHRFNRMTLMDKVLGQSRLDSYVVHYASAPNQEILLATIQGDLEQWAKDAPDYIYPRNIVIDVTGGIGDQATSEPAVRYFCNVLQPDDNIIILTDYPEFYSHISKTLINKKDFKGLQEPYIVLMPQPHINAHPMHTIAPATQVHSVDFACLCLCGQMIPDEDKRIRIDVTDKGYEEVLSLLKSPYVDMNKKIILVHPGLGWESKTFPKVWWEEIVDTLSKEYQVIIIGKHMEDGNTTNRNGVIKIDYPDNALDLTEMLTTDGLVALIRLSDMLISNDSGPIHIAGAFDNWIVLIPTCKHPDNVLPYRRGNDKHYKSVAIYDKLTMDNKNSSPVNFKTEGHRLDYLKGNIEDYIPDSQKVIRIVKDILGGNIWRES